MNEHQINSFWSKVDIRQEKKSCWNWNGAKKRTGYGNVRIDKKYKLAHRVAFELSTCSIPNGMIVCHVCDNPSCCNPSHLMLGTAKSNASDMLIKNRAKKPESAARGSVNGNSKLKESDVLDIRKIYSTGFLDQYKLARKYKVSQPTIGAIVNRKTWSHI